MKKIVLVAGALAASSISALAADDPIAVRQALMANNGAAGAVAGAMLKGELPYSSAVGKAAIYAMNATAQAYGDFFPEGSVDAERSHAAPAIWEDMAGFQAALEEFRAASTAAVEAAGEDGPADAEAFGAAMGPVFDTCKGCHDDYRLSDD
jgi:cytochrome c556